MAGICDEESYEGKRRKSSPSLYTTQLWELDALSQTAGPHRSDMSSLKATYAAAKQSSSLIRSTHASMTQTWLIRKRLSHVCIQLRNHEGASSLSHFYPTNKRREHAWPYVLCSGTPSVSSWLRACSRKARKDPSAIEARSSIGLSI